ncbi:MAG: hypothetical protein MUO72_09410 [Bacteroidales bacterium]|nr:hypothetical protein [Bacteroidales bacterium]
MATPKGYELKRGVLLQAFGDASKTCTNDTLTDELGDWYMANQPEKVIYFSRLPATPVIPPSVVIIPPTFHPIKEKIPEEKKEQMPEINTKLIADVLNAVSGAEPKKEIIEPVKVVKKTPKKTVKAKK